MDRCSSIRFACKRDRSRRYKVSASTVRSLVLIFTTKMQSIFYHVYLFIYRIEATNSMHPLVVLEILSKSDKICVGDVREYIINWIERQNAQVFFRNNSTTMFAYFSSLPTVILVTNVVYTVIIKFIQQITLVVAGLFVRKVTFLKIFYF